MSEKWNASDLLGSMGETPLEKRVKLLQADLAQKDTVSLARRSGALYIPKYDSLQLQCWGRLVKVNLSDWQAISATDGKPLSLIESALLFFYLTTTDGTGSAGQWLAFSELPDGRFYSTAFQSYSGRRLAQHFANDVTRLQASAMRVHGIKIDLGDAGFAFQVFPQVRLAVVMWQGDDEFPPSYQVLFDKAISHHLPTDGCAIAGSILTQSLLRSL